MEENGGWFNRNVDYSVLQETRHYDEPDTVFFVCPMCGGDYLAEEITDVCGQAMCIDCWNEFREFDKNLQNG